MSDPVRNGGRPPRPGLPERLGRRALDVAQAATAQALETGYALVDRFLPQAAVSAGLAGAELGLDVLSQLAPGSKLVSELARVDFEGVRRQDDLKADWFGLTEDWLFERSRSELGEWSTDADGTPRVTITRRDFTQDLSSKPAHRAAVEKLQGTFPHPEPGDSVTHDFIFTGEGSASGRYDALE